MISLKQARAIGLTTEMLVEARDWRQAIQKASGHSVDVGFDVVKGPKDDETMNGWEGHLRLSKEMAGLMLASVERLLSERLQNMGVKT